MRGDAMEGTDRAEGPEELDGIDGAELEDGELANEELASVAGGGICGGTTMKLPSFPKPIPSFPI